MYLIKKFGHEKKESQRNWFKFKSCRVTLQVSMSSNLIPNKKNQTDWLHVGPLQLLLYSFHRLYLTAAYKMNKP